MILSHRPRRLRTNEAIRAMVEEVFLSPNQLIAPLFLTEGKNKIDPIISMPGYARISLDRALKEIQELQRLGVNSVVLFPVVTNKDKNERASQALNKNFFYYQAISSIKKHFPEILVATDVALDPYSSQGHDGLVDKKTGEILNDETVEILVKMSLLQAEAGADIIAPSDMMDGRIGAIRLGLENAGFSNTLIMSYCAKYASAFYGPFRDALDSAPKKGDKKTYQMNYKNSRDVLREAELDENEGADILMVKPALPYLDIIQKLKQNSKLPIAAYQVSGEYAMIKATAERGWGNLEQLMLESLFGIRRAGADIILTYFAKEFALWYKKNGK